MCDICVDERQNTVSEKLIKKNINTNIQYIFAQTFTYPGRIWYFLVHSSENMIDNTKTSISLSGWRKLFLIRIGLPFLYHNDRKYPNDPKQNCTYPSF